MTWNNVLVFQSAFMLVLLNTLTKGQLQKEGDCVDIPAVEECDWHKVRDSMKKLTKMYYKIKCLYLVRTLCVY